MANYFDQFDPVEEKPKNFFDKFDVEDAFRPSSSASLFAKKETPQKKKLTKEEAMWLAARLGFFDTARGIGQLAGIDEDLMALEQRQLNEAMTEYGWPVMAAYAGGLIADPAGWVIPVSRLKHVHSAGKMFSHLVLPSMAAGGVAGGLGYVDPESQSLVGDGPMSKTEQAVLGATLGGVAAPVAKGISKGWEKGGDVAWDILKHPSGAGATVGALAGYNWDDNASTPENMRNTLIGAAIGVTGGLPKLTDRLGVTNDLTGKFGRAIIPDYRLADDWINARSSFKGQRRVTQGRFDELVGRVSGLPLEARQKLYHMLTNPDEEVDEALVGLKDETRGLVNELASELVELGVLNPRVFEKNKFSYLHRTYNDPKRINKVPSEVSIRTIGDELKLRGYVKDVSGKLFEGGRRPDDLGEWEVIEKLKNGKYKVRRDWTPDERLEMGEVTDSMLAIDRTGKLLANDTAAFKFFRDMANNPSIAKAEPEGDFIYGVPGDKGFGALGEKYVTKEIYDDLMGIGNIRDNLLTKWKTSKLGRGYRKLNAFWKGTKTIANPAVHFNNFVSNIVHYDFGGGKASDFGRAWRDIFSKNEAYKEAEALGVFGGFFTSELAAGADDIYRLYSHMGRGAKDNMDMAEKAAGWTEKLFRKTKNMTWDKMASMYAFEDQIFRMALYRTERDKLMAMGMNSESAQTRAARKAREWFVDYERSSPVLDTLREGPLPFVAYMYGVIPKLAETAAKHPIKMAKWAGLLHGINYVGEKFSEEPQSEIDKQRNLLSGERGKGWWGVPGMPPNMIKLPEMLSPKTRDAWYLNTSRMYPGGDIFQGTEGGVGQIPGVPQWMQPSFGAAGGVVYPALGIKQFTGQPIPPTWKDRGEEMGKQFTPNFPIPGFPSYSGVKIDRAASGKYSPKKDVHTPTSAYLSGVGIKVTPVSTRKERRRLGYSFIRRKKELDTERKMILGEFRAGGISREEKNRALKDIAERRRELAKEKRKALSGK